MQCFHNVQDFPRYILTQEPKSSTVHSKCTGICKAFMNCLLCHLASNVWPEMQLQTLIKEYYRSTSTNVQTTASTSNLPIQSIFLLREKRLPKKRRYQHSLTTGRQRKDRPYSPWTHRAAMHVYKTSNVPLQADTSPKPFPQCLVLKKNNSSSDNPDYKFRENNIVL